MQLDHLTLGGATMTHRLEWPICPNCGDTLLAAESSALLGRGHVQNSWCCDACGFRFETDIRLQPIAAAELDD